MKSAESDGHEAVAVTSRRGKRRRSEHHEQHAHDGNHPDGERAARSNRDAVEQEPASRQSRREAVLDEDGRQDHAG